MIENKISVITRKDINKMAMRGFLLQNSHNFERMISLGTLYVLNPVLKKIYQDKPIEVKKQAYLRHLEYFNSHPMMTPFILGITLALEESTDDNEKDSVLAIKTSLMGPLAGLGDSLLNFTLFPIAGSIGASLAIQGNFMGAILMFLIINLVYFPLRFMGPHIGFKKGKELLMSSKGKETLTRITNMANVVGVVITGTLITTVVKINLGIQYGTGDNAIVLQKALDGIVPNLLPFLTTLLCYYFVKKWNGKHIVSLIFTIIVISCMLFYFGILV